MTVPTSPNFATSYMELCKHNRVRPLPVICVTLPHSLDFTTDRVKMDDWGPILNSLTLDRSLKTVSVRSRYQCRKPMNDINSEDKVRTMGKAPVVLSRYLLEWLSHSVAQCVRNSPSLTSLELEGVPLPIDCLAALCVGLTGTVTLRHLSLRRCYIGDESCDLVCRTVADVQSIRSLNLGQCDLSKNSGPSLAAALCRQKLSLYHETWKESLRYREPNLEDMPGLRRLTLNGNPRLGDDAVGELIEAIRDSLWLKALDLQNCGLTDHIGHEIIKLLEHNTTLAIVDARMNASMSDEIVDEIFSRLEANASDRNARSEYRWLSLPQKDGRNVVSAGARRRNRYEETIDVARPKSAFVPKSRRPFLAGSVRKTPVSDTIIAKRNRTKIEPINNMPEANISFNAEKVEEKLKLDEKTANMKTRQSLHLDIQSRIDSAIDASFIEPEKSTSKDIDVNHAYREDEDGNVTIREAFSVEYLNSILQQLSEARMTNDRLKDERKITEQRLAEERVLREIAETKLRTIQRDVADLKTALKRKEKETKGYLLISQRSLDDIAASFERLLKMLSGATRNSESSRYNNHVEDEYATTRAEIRRRFAHLIRKTKSESNGRGHIVECEESSIIEASNANTAAKKFAKSESDVRTSLPPLVQPLRLERNIGDSPDVISSRTRRTQETYRERVVEDFEKNSLSTPSERARAIFAEIVNGEAILHLGAHGS